jgi:hypothetical protein
VSNQTNSSAELVIVCGSGYLKKVVADRLHIGGIELVDRHLAALRYAGGIAEVLFEPGAIMPVADAIEHGTYALAASAKLVANGFLSGA